MQSEAYREISEQENHHWWFLARRAILTSVIAKLPFAKQPEILELGAGTGGNLAMLKQFGKVWAVEMDDFAREFAKSQAGPDVEIEYGFCPDLIPFSDRKFDLICMLDVLEHVEKDDETLVKIQSMLSDKGFLLITVPAHQWLWSGHDDFLHHKRRYSKFALQQKLIRAGFKASRLTYFNFFLFPIISALRLKDRYLNRNVSGVNTPPPPLVNSLLRTVFASERGLLARVDLPIGISLLAVAQRG